MIRRFVQNVCKKLDAELFSPLDLAVMAALAEWVLPVQGAWALLWAVPLWIAASVIVRGLAR